MPIRRSVIETGRAINVPDAQRDGRFNHDLDRYTGYSTRSMLLGPVVAQDGKVLGLIEFVNKIPRTATDLQAARQRDNLPGLSADGDADARLRRRSTMAGNWVPFSEADERVLRLICAHAAAVIQQAKE